MDVDHFSIVPFYSRVDLLSSGEVIKFQRFYSHQNRTPMIGRVFWLTTSALKILTLYIVLYCIVSARSARY